MTLSFVPGPTRMASVGRPHARPGLDRVAGAASILEAIRIAPVAVGDIATSVEGSASAERVVVGELVAAVRDPSDALIGIAAVHALAAIPGDGTARALADVLRSGPGPMPAHAAWASARRSPSAELVDPMVDVLVSGGLGGMHAQTALERWAVTEPWLVAAALRRGLLRANGIDGRRHIIETLGLVPDDRVLSDLESVAVDRSQEDVVRVAAVAAFGDRVRAPMPRSISTLAHGDDRVAEAVRLTQMDRALRAIDGSCCRSSRCGSTAAARGGLCVAQVHLGAVLDPDLLHSGMGDTGGIATLLVRLGVALGRTPGIADVVTIGRGTARDILDGAGPSDGGPRYIPVALEPEAGTAFSDPWPARIVAERGIRRVFGHHGRPDLIHLRMADAGTLAAANVAAMLGIPTVFSLAPDPHGLIASREAAGDLDRGNFGTEDARFHLWYRVDLVERLARQADQVALFPREQLVDQLRELIGIDVTAWPGRFTVVPEGIDVARIRNAVAVRASESALGPAASVGPDDTRPATPIDAPASGALADLLERVAALPTTRHGLPIVLSVGRLNELKGMARLADAFASDPRLRARATLVIVGGDLDEPTTAEVAELDRIGAAVAAQPDLETAMILLGHRPNGDVPALLAAVRHGFGRLIGPDGAYASASRKEEFGLAIVEALAAGLPVVAPLAGGPATYVDDGWTGCLVDTTDPAALVAGIARALDLAGRPGRAAYAAETIASRYDIAGMAQAMTTVYSRAAKGALTPMAS